MSENLKRAESLFNRIMNQNLDSTHEHKNQRKVIPHHNNVIPARDVIKLSEETLLRIPNGHHVLPYCWTIWHHSRLRQRPKEDEAVNEENAQTPVDSYLQTTKEISFLSFDGEGTKSIGSIEQLWLSLSSIKPGYELPVGTELLAFKTGINPVWEDPVNMKGGRWVFRFNRRFGVGGPSHGADDEGTVLRIRKRTTLIWERLVLKTLSGSIIPESSTDQYQDLVLSDISGIVMSVRKDEDIISIWNSNLNFHGKDSKKLTSFQARRVICDSILRIIRECDLIANGGDCVQTLDSGSSARVFGVSFDYRLHSDNNTPVDGKHHHRDYHKEHQHYTPRRYKHREDAQV